MENLNQIKEQALKEIQEEDFRVAVDKYKAKLRKQKWWHKLIPFKIVIIRRESC